MVKNYVVQNKITGQVIDYCETLNQSKFWTETYPEFEAIPTKDAHHIKVVYTELGGPWGYGHQEESFATYNQSLRRCVANLINWMKRECRVFGPDPRDIRDYFRGCRLYVDTVDKSDWLFKQLDKMDMKTMYL